MTTQEKQKPPNSALMIPGRGGFATN